MTLIWKNVGETPLESLDNYKKENGISPITKAVCCGRLDPMAQGYIICLFGLDCKLMKNYLGLSKEYSVNAILGISTDTGDALGIVTKTTIISSKDVENFTEKIKQYNGKHFTHPYPSYSSFVLRSKKDESVKKPLWWFAINDRLNEVDIPSKEIFLFKTSINRIKFIPAEKYIDSITIDINKINKKHNFRQSEILENWQKFDKEIILVSINIQIIASSGAYVRQIIELLGKEVGIACHSHLITREAFLDKK